MRVYHICYLMSCYGLERELDVIAKSKAEAYDKAVYEKIPLIEGGHYPYGAFKVVGLFVILGNLSILIEEA